MPPATSSSSRFARYVADVEGILDRRRSSPVKVREISALTEELVAAPDWLAPEHRRAEPDRYARYLLHRDRGNRFVVMSLVWLPGQATPVHDHSCWGVMGLITGELEEVLYERLDDGIRPEVVDDGTDVRRTLAVVEDSQAPRKGQVRHNMKATTPVLPGPGSAQDALADVLRAGAQQMLATAIEAEVTVYIEEHQLELDEGGHRLVVRNGRHGPRTIDTGVGTIEVAQPRVNDRRVDSDGTRFRFTSKILPPYLRRTKNLEEFIPWLYLKGISTNDFSECLQHLTGNSAASLSPSTVVRLKEVWSKECQEWSRRPLAGKHYVYLWVDGVHFNIRLEEDRQCILVVMGATQDGKKELVAIADGYRESAQSWKEILLDLKQRGLEHAPALAIGDGALGFWKALAEEFPTTRTQRCWVHKTANVLNKLPKHKQAAAKGDLQEIWMAETRDNAATAFGSFIAKYGSKYPQAVACLQKDRDELLAFYDFPAEHWTHLRTTNPIESMFATVRLRHRRTKGSGSRVACLAMVFKLAEAASKKWRRLTGAELVRDVIDGVQFKDGIRAEGAA